MATLREQLRDLLKAGPLSARDISQALGISEKEVPEHLEHLRKSLRHGPERLEIEAPACMSCGFVFSERQRLSAPGSCPQCKRGRIRRARFSLH